MNFSSHLKEAFKVNPIKVFIKMMKTDCGKVAFKRTTHVIRITMLVYCPLIAMFVVLVAIGSIMALPFFGIMMLSVIPFTKHILIPLSEKKREEIWKSIKDK